MNAPAYGGQWMPHLDFNDQDPLEVHLTYELVVDVNVVSSRRSTPFSVSTLTDFAKFSAVTVTVSPSTDTESFGSAKW